MPFEVRQQFYSAVQQHGLDYVNQQVIAALQSAANEAMLRAMGNSRLRTAAFGACTGAPWLTIAGFYFGIVALAVSGPVGWAIAAGGIAVGGAGLLTGC